MWTSFKSNKNDDVCVKVCTSFHYLLSITIDLTQTNELSSNRSIPRVCLGAIKKVVHRCIIFLQCFAAKVTMEAPIIGSCQESSTKQLIDLLGIIAAGSADGCKHHYRYLPVFLLNVFVLYLYKLFHI